MSGCVGASGSIGDIATFARMGLAKTDDGSFTRSRQRSVASLVHQRANSAIMQNQGVPIIDCHQHFIDSRRLRYPVFMQRSAGFEALVGDYSALPRVYLPEDYARDVNGLGVVKTVWAEFISDDPMGEVIWAQELARLVGLKA
jgi:hypothetical protein